MANLNNTIINGTLRVINPIYSNILHNSGEVNIGVGGTTDSDSVNSPIVRIKGGRIKIENFGKYIELGPSNGSFTHFSSNATFYFNNNTQIAGNLCPYENNLYYLGYSNSKWKELHAVTIYENGTAIDTIMDNKIQAAIGDAIASSY